MDILVEQLVYGSFPFWNRGYDVLARSPGCRADWVADVLAACRQFGEAPSGVIPSSSLFAVRLPSGPWAVVGVEPQGLDDRGRPGALAFHALLVEPRDYRKAGSDPFAFAGALGRDWSAGTSLEALFWTVEPQKSTGPPLDPRTRRVVEALTRGRRVALESAEPIDALAREVWSALPDSIRRRGSLATWAFGNANRYDLVALPRLAGVALDGSYDDPASIDEEPPEQVESPKPLPLYRALAVAGLAGAVAAGLAWRGWDGPRDSGGSPEAHSANPAEADPPIGPETRARIVAGLEALADRLEAFEIGPPGAPAALMARISKQVRYRGPTLSGRRAGPARRRERPRPRPGPRLARAAQDLRRRPPAARRLRPAPAASATRPAREVVPPPTPTPGRGCLGRLADALARDGPVRPTPLAARYPALSDYARFLGRLPRALGRNGAGRL